MYLIAQFIWTNIEWSDTFYKHNFQAEDNQICEIIYKRIHFQIFNAKSNIVGHWISYRYSTTFGTFCYEDGGGMFLQDTDTCLQTTQRYTSD